MAASVNPRWAAHGVDAVGFPAVAAAESVESVSLECE